MSTSAFIYLNAPVSGCCRTTICGQRWGPYKCSMFLTPMCMCAHVFFFHSLELPVDCHSHLDFPSILKPGEPLFGWLKCSGKCDVSYVHGIYNRFGGDLVQKWKHSFNDGAMLWRLTQTGLTHTRHPMNPHKVTIQGKIIKDRKILYLWGQMHDTVNMDLLQSFGWPWLGAALLVTCLFNSDCIKKRLTSCGIGDQWNQWCKSAFRSGTSQV